MFSTRLALIVLTARDTAGPDTPASRNLLRHLTNRMGESGDGYALRATTRAPGRRDVRLVSGAAARSITTPPTLPPLSR
ncbi:hypothetical protein [Kitasatospora herbaricolor]|uniref:hypothetical protein n=1 Tax=Kitasatospora herbaricolor TaxID=68217 RepID=UPI0036DF7AC8